MRRFTIHSTIEVPVTVDAGDPWQALRLGMQILGRDHRLARVTFDLRKDGMVIASDGEHNEHFAVVAEVALAA